MTFMNIFILCVLLKLIGFNDAAVSPVLLWGTKTTDNLNTGIRIIDSSVFANDVVVPLLHNHMIIVYLEDNLKPCDFKCTDPHSEKSCYVYLKQVEMKTYYLQINNPLEFLGPYAATNMLYQNNLLQFPLDCITGRLHVISFNKSHELEHYEQLQQHDFLMSIMSHRFRSCKVAYLYMASPILNDEHLLGTKSRFKRQEPAEDDEKDENEEPPEDEKKDENEESPEDEKKDENEESPEDDRTDENEEPGEDDKTDENEEPGEDDITDENEEPGEDDKKGENKPFTEDDEKSSKEHPPHMKIKIIKSEDGVIMHLVHDKKIAMAYQTIFYSENFNSKSESGNVTDNLKYFQINYIHTKVLRKDSYEVTMSLNTTETIKMLLEKSGGYLYVYKLVYKDEFYVPAGEITVPEGFSYYCRSLTFVNPNSNTVTLGSINLKRVQFQLVHEKIEKKKEEPSFKHFGEDEDKDDEDNAVFVFDTSWDCEGFFPIATIMTLSLSFLFVIVVTMGIANLTEIKAVDRFDDPFTSAYF